jgi:hypothetical protein
VTAVCSQLELTGAGSEVAWTNTAVSRPEIKPSLNLDEVHRRRMMQRGEKEACSPADALRRRSC